MQFINYNKKLNTTNTNTTTTTKHSTRFYKKTGIIFLLLQTVVKRYFSLAVYTSIVFVLCTLSLCGRNNVYVCMCVCIRVDFQAITRSI